MINLNEILHRFIAEFQEIESVTGITMSNSKLSNYQEDLSEIKINIFYESPLDQERRYQTIMKFATQVKHDALGAIVTDHCVLRDFPIELDICYLNIAEIERLLIQTMQNYHVSRSNSTQLTYFIRHANIVFDRHGKLFELRQNYTQNYPDTLRDHIITLHYPLLKASYKSYYIQLERALKRFDIINVSGLLHEFLKSYVELIFALNQQYHPYEKRVLSIMEERCPLLPNLIKQHIELLYIYAGREDKQLLTLVDLMINQITDLLNEQNLL